MNQYLKAMTATEQVGAMFLIVFGCLTVAGIVVFLLSIREHAATAEGDTRRVLLVRADGVLRSSWVMTIVFWVGWAVGRQRVATVRCSRMVVVLRAARVPDPVADAPQRPPQPGTGFLRRSCRCSMWLVGTGPFRPVHGVHPGVCVPGDPGGQCAGQRPGPRFLERNAKLQWGIMVCMYGMSHVPALLLLEFPRFSDRKGAFLVIFLVLVVQTCMVVQQFFVSAPVAPGAGGRRP
jgi:phosphatidate cytidylyltransferase